MDRSRVGTLKSMRSRWGKIIAGRCIRPISTPSQGSAFAKLKALLLLLLLLLRRAGAPTARRS
jgi:hypothetical protein